MTSEPTAEIGYMAIVIGLLDILEDVNGIEVTEDLLYMNFYQQGEHVGKKLGTGKDPQTAIKELIEYIRPCYDIDIKNEKASKGKYTIDLEFKNCLIRKMSKNRGLAIKNPLCRCTQGFIQGALAFMTGKMVDIDINIINWDICIGILEFKEKRDIFDFI